jgi:hypothetical protein
MIKVEIIQFLHVIFISVYGFVAIYDSVIQYTFISQ